MKLVTIALLQTCMIAGLPRSPVEGNQTVPEDEAKRHFDSVLAVFVNDDGDDS